MMNLQEVSPRDYEIIESKVKVRIIIASTMT